MLHHDQLIQTDRSFEWRQVSSGDEIVEDIFNDRTIRGTKSASWAFTYLSLPPLGNEPAHFSPPRGGGEEGFLQEFARVLAGLLAIQRRRVNAELAWETRRTESRTKGEGDL